MIRQFFSVGFWTMISRMLGLAREILLSYVLGATQVTDAFFVALKLPNFFRRFSAEGALNSSFVPYYTRFHTEKGIKEANFLLSRIFIIMSFFLFVFVVFMEFNILTLVKITALGLREDSIRMAVDFASITFPYIFFISLTALLTGAANSLGKFAQGAASQSILNITMIFVLIWAVMTKDLSYFDIGYNLCIAMMIAGVLQQLWMHVVCHNAGIHIFWVKKPLNYDAKEILKRMIPGIIGASVAQLSIFVDTIMASFLRSGSISFLYYADRLYQLPLSIFGTAIGTVILPPLSRLFAENKQEDALKLQRKSIIFSLLLTCPAAVGLVSLSHSLIQMIYGHGKFSSYDTEAVSQALAMFAIGLPAHVISKIFNATFFSYGDTKTPLKYSLLSVGFNIVLNFLLIPYFSHVGLALATSCAAWLNIILQGSYLINKKYFNLDEKIIIFLLKLFISSLIMFIVLEILDIILCDFKIYSGQISHIFILVIFGIFSFFCMIYFLKIFYIKYLYEM